MVEIRPYNGFFIGSCTSGQINADERVAAFMERLWQRVEANEARCCNRLKKTIQKRHFQKPLKAAYPSWYEPKSNLPVSRRFRAVRETPMPNWMIDEGYSRNMPVRISMVYPDDRNRRV